MPTQTDETIQEGLDDDMSQFAAVMESIRLDGLPEFALTIRKSQLNLATLSLDDALNLLCEVVPTPLSGSYHVVHVLKFSDDVR